MGKWRILLITIFLSYTAFLRARASNNDRDDAKHYYPSSYNAQSKSSIAVKYFSASAGAIVLYGWRHVNYNSEKFFIGGAGFTGQVGNSAQTGSFSYGGLVAGYDKRLGNRVHADWGVLAGGGGGKVQDSTSTKESGGVILEPWFGLNWKIGSTTDFNLSGSYIYMPNNDDFLGAALAVRIDFALQ